MIWENAEVPRSTFHAQERGEDAGSRHGQGYVPHFLQFGFQGVRPFQY